MDVNHRMRLLIYAPVPLFKAPTGYMMEDQACNGLRLWAENFDSLVVMHPLDHGTLPGNWVPIEQIGPAMKRIKIVPLPTAYRPDKFLVHLSKTREIIREEIKKADYLSFSIGGLFGDWGSVSCYEAHRMKRKYAIWTDRVESEVVRRTSNSGNWRQRIRSKLYHRPMARLERYLIRRAELGLFHGKETFNAYSPYCSNAHLVHDIHIKQSNHITPTQIQEKTQVLKSGPIRIVYVGRADPMKGGLDWIKVLSELKQSGVEFKATWYGEGQELNKMKSLVCEEQLEDNVRFPGFLKDRSKVLDALRQSSLFLFCHKSPESPRCLIEALISGTPIIGYEGAFARDLISEHRGGRLAELGSTEQLAGIVRELDQDRKVLTSLFVSAARDGEKFTDQAVFKHRSDLIYKYL